MPAFSSERFHEVLALFDALGAPVPALRHMANSGAILQLPESHFDMVRPGVMLYGIYPGREAKRVVDVQTAATWHSQVSYSKITLAGRPVSYGSLWEPEEPSRIVTIPCGYADGYLGMGTPLLIVGASAGKLLPKAGAWMELVKKLFGVMMLAVAAWMLARIVPDRVALVLWAVPALLLAWLLWTGTRSVPGAKWGLRAAGMLAALYGVALTAGSALGGTDPLAPIPALAAKTHELPFRRISSVADLDREVAAAHASGRSVLVDFSADWCTSCKEMERYTFTDPTVQAALAGTVLLRADVTRNDADDQALLKRFGIFGPPTIAFYGVDGQERARYRVVGYMKADAFAARTRAALNASS